MNRDILYYENRLAKLAQKPVENHNLIKKCERKLRQLKEKSE